MTLLMARELEAPYPYVISEDVVLEVKRLLEAVLEMHESARAVTQTGEAQRSIMRLEGLGREIWQSVDPAEYIRGLRDEWNTR